MRTVGYIRVSTEEQARGGISLDLQVAKINAYCSLEELGPVEIVADEGISGYTIKARPGIREILERVKTRRVDAVVIYKLDRLARNTIDALKIATLMESNNVALHSICEKLDTRSAMGRFFFTLMASLAEMERGIISERVRDAMQRLRETNQPRSQNAPYGFKIAGNLLVANPDELAVIQRVVELHASGLSIYRITKVLTDERIFNRRGNPFDKNQIKNIILIKEAA